jgi:hypothetical protein
VPRSVIELKVRGLQGADWALRFNQSDAREIFEEISVSDTARELLDLDRISLAIDRWPTSEWNEQSVLGEYRLSLIGALSGGMFALLYEQAAAKSERI